MAKSDKSDSPNKSAFQSKASFEDYLTNSFNIGIYKTLTEDEDWQRLFEPLQFFNLLYEQIHFVDHNKTKPVTVKNHLQSLELEKEQHYYLIDRMVAYYRDSEDKQLQICLGFINDIAIELRHELFPDEYLESLPEPFDFYEDQMAAEKIEDLQERLQFLKERKKEFDQYKAEGINWDLGDKSTQYQLEIDYVQDLIERQQPVKGKPGKEIEPIWWKKSNRLLRYLMDELAKLDYIDKASPVNKHIKEHFINRERKPFTDSIKQNSSGAVLNKSGKPKDHEEIDHLINSLKDQPE